MLRSNPNTQDTDDVDLGDPLPVAYMMEFNRPPKRTSSWSILSLLIAVGCIGREVLYPLYRMSRVEQQPQSGADAKGDVDCRQEKYARLCVRGQTTRPPLPLSASERCLAIGLVLERSSVEFEKQNAYFVERTAYFDRRLAAARAGNVSEEDGRSLVRAAARLDRQVTWYQEVSDRATALEEEYKATCEYATLHPDKTDAAIEAIATTEYASLWK